ncbi:MAG: MerR family transcriptional regulator [Myxococcales bacterium]|nr:MerR family transcriptional regulator [Myxococcales bacterium]
MIELYSIKDAAKIFGQTDSRLRYWMQSGFLWPSVRRGGQYFYTFDDLIAVRTAIELLDSGLSVQKVRKAIAELRKELPDGVRPTSKLRVCSDGKNVVVMKDDVAYEVESGQVVMAFALSSVHSRIAEILPMRPNQDSGAVPQLVDEKDEQTQRQELPSAYQLFLHACSAEASEDFATAERYLRQCLELENSMAAARTNLGNLLHRQGNVAGAREQYDLALLHEPNQPEARFNLANLLEEMGERDMAIAEYRHVCSRSPDFADAHFNLGLLLAEVGGKAQAQEHLGHYLRLDQESEWAEQARSLMATA